jgi:hypothetical protein
MSLLGRARPYDDSISSDQCRVMSLADSDMTGSLPYNTLGVFSSAKRCKKSSVARFGFIW